ncbi:MAG: patatin-like phospholipase family protein [Bacteroidetes bacterium]|nr:patatin-like phospholipase family protein [Bacteroidota bacterium]
MKTIRILSIDGGGLRGVVPLTILNEFKTRLKLYAGKEIWECFDLIAGTSTGGLITSAITLRDKNAAEKKAKYTINDILNVYIDHGKDIFPQRGWLGNKWHALKDIFRPTFGEEGIAKVFKDVLGEHRISDCLTNIMVSTYDLNNNVPLFFKSLDNAVNKNLDALLYDICRATSAGPTYLPTYIFNYPKNPDTEKPHRNCIDGGVYVNNPSMAALAEFVKNYAFYDKSIARKEDVDFKNIFVLSVGTGTYAAPIKDNASATKGELYWAKTISDVMMRGVNKTTDYEMNEIMEDGNYLRLSINIDNEEHADMSNSSKETTQYLIKAAQEQVLNNADKMNKLNAFIQKSGL